MHKNSWKWRKNISPVGGQCEHNIWWSIDCPDCSQALEEIADKYLAGIVGSPE